MGMTSNATISNYVNDYNAFDMPFPFTSIPALREAVEAYHDAADGKCYVDTSNHRIITDPTPQVPGQELPALVTAGYTAAYYHGPGRPQGAEREATHRAISHADLTGVPTTIAHISGREPMEQIQRATSGASEAFGR